MLQRDARSFTLGFYAVRTGRERWRCEEPIGDLAAKLELTADGDWVVGAPIEVPLSEWRVATEAAPAGTVTVTVNARDERAFTFSGTIDVRSADGSSALRGPFVGEYCPTKAIARAHPEPLAGVAWTDAPIASDALPSTPIAAVFAGSPSTVAHVVLRDRDLVFYREDLPDPCDEPESGGWVTSYDDAGAIRSRTGARSRVDYVDVALVDAPIVGRTIRGSKPFAEHDANAIRAASLHLFEADGYRSFTYEQRFTAALQFDTVDDVRATGRIVLALGDSGRSMIVGRFDAKRCTASR